MKPLISVVVVNYRADEDVDRWRRQLENEDDFELIVVDNSAGVRGYGEGLNEGIAYARADYVIGANPDVETSAEDLKKLVDVLQRNPKVGLVGPQIINAQGQVQITCSAVPSPLMALIEYSFLRRLPLLNLFSRAYRLWGFDNLSSRFVPVINGSLFACRREDWKRIGGADEELFLYFEEFDFSKKLSILGLSPYFLAEAKAHHEGQHSTKQRSDTSSIFRNSRRHWLKKWYGFRGEAVSRLLEYFEDRQDEQ